MTFIKNTFLYFKGKKTYIIGCLMIALGFLTLDNALMLEGFGLLTLRGAIAKSGI